MALDLRPRPVGLRFLAHHRDGQAGLEADGRDEERGGALRRGEVIDVGRQARRDRVRDLLDKNVSPEVAVRHLVKALGKGLLIATREANQMPGDMQAGVDALAGLGAVFFLLVKPPVRKA